jgi:hypothetical protein
LAALGQRYNGEVKLRHARLDGISDKDISANLTTVQSVLMAQVVKMCVRYKSSVFAVCCVCCSVLEERAVFLSYSALCGNRHLVLPDIRGK